MADATTPVPLRTYIDVKHGFAFKGQYFCDEPTTHVLVTPGNFAIGGGFQEGKAKYYNGPIPKDYVLRKGDLVVTMTDLSKAGDTLGYPALIPDTPNQVYLHNQRVGLVSITDQNRLDRDFLYYLLRTEEYRNHILATASGSTVRHTSPSRIGEFATQLPPLAQQQVAAAILRALDYKIDQNRRTAKALERLPRATFKAWFVDFEPVKAKAAGATSFPGMPAAVFAALPNRLTNSPIGPVPEGWEVRTLEEVAESVKGLSYKGSGLVPPSAEDHAGSLPLHNLNSVYEGGGYKNEGLKRYTGEFKDRHVISPGDLIVANTEQGHEYRLIGFPAIVPERYGERGLFSHHLFRVRPLPQSPLGVQFLYHAIMSARIRDEIVGCTNGTTVNMLSIDGLKRPQLCAPNPQLANEFEQRARNMYELSESLIDESSKLAALRDYLLPRLLSGRVRVVPPQK